MVRALLLAALLAACAHEEQYAEPADDLVAAVTVDAWEARGLPEPNEKHCQTERFRIEWAADPADFLRLCQVPTTAAFACFRWRLEVHPAMGLFSRVYPAAILRPDVGADLVEGLGVHELLHGLIYCVLDRPLDDPYDYNHTDPRVWIGPGGDTSAEAVARAALEKM